MTTPTQNDTGIHPCQGYVLCEYVELFDSDKILIPDSVREAMQPTNATHITVVLEDSRVGEEVFFGIGTRVIVAKAHGFSHEGRKFIFAEYYNICGYIEKE